MGLQTIVKEREFSKAAEKSIQKKVEILHFWDTGF